MSGPDYVQELELDRLSKENEDLKRRLAEAEKNKVIAYEQLARVEEVRNKLEAQVKEDRFTIIEMAKALREEGDRIRAASDELKRLCPTDIEKCRGHCPKQDSNPCEYYEVWMALRGKTEEKIRNYIPDSPLSISDELKEQSKKMREKNLDKRIVV